MFFGKPKSFLGIDIGKAGVKIVELKKEKGRPVLFTYVKTNDAQPIVSGDQMTMAPSAEEQAKLASVLSAVCARARVSTRTAVVSIPASQIFHALVTLPIVQKDDLSRMLEAEVKKLLPYPLAEAQLDFQVVTKDDQARSQRVLVSAVPKATVSFYSGACKSAGIVLDALEPESIALSRALLGRDAATALMVDIGDIRTNFFIVDNTYPITQHSIELGAKRLSGILETMLGVTSDISDQIKRDLFDYLFSHPDNPDLSKEKFLQVFAPLIEPIVKEIEYSIELYMRQSNTKNKVLEKIILTGGGSFFPYIAEYIGDMFKIKTYVGDPWGRVVYPDGMQPILRSLAPRMAVAIGLALRNVV